jgi:hypothetical protein
MTTNSREPMRDSAFAWAMEQLPLVVDACNRSRLSNTAQVEYHGMVDGIVWSDELPEVGSDARTVMQKTFCVLVYLRTSVILGEELSENSSKLLDLLRSTCPEWSFMSNDRWTSERVADYDEVRSRFFTKIDRLSSNASGTAGQET